MREIIESNQNIPYQLLKKPNRIFSSGDKKEAGRNIVSFAEAEEILGPYFINPHKIGDNFSYPRNQLGRFHQEMPSRKMIQSLQKSDSILVPGPPAGLTTHGVISLFKNIFDGMSHYHLSSSEFKNLSHIHTGWLILNKNPLRNSQNKTWRQQSSIVNSDKYIPELGKLIWSLNLYWLINGYKLFNNKSLRTSTVNKYGERVIISGQVPKVKFTDNSVDNDLIVVVGTRY